MRWCGGCSASTPSDASQFVVMESEVDGAERLYVAEAKANARTRVLSTLSLLALGFFATCGGPISSEAIITGVCIHLSVYISGFLQRNYGFC